MSIAEEMTATSDVKAEEKKMGESFRVPVPNINIPFLGHVHSLALKQLICARSIAGGISSIATASFGFLRSQAVAVKGEGSYREFFSDTLKREGIDFAKNCIQLSGITRTYLEREIMFATYESVKRWEDKILGEDIKWLPAVPRALSVATVAGAAAAFTSTLVMYPMSAIGDRMFLIGDDYKSMGGALVKIIRNDGVMELCRGLAPRLISMVPEGAAEFYTYELLKKRYMQKMVKESALKSCGRSMMAEIVSREGLGLRRSYWGVGLRYFSMTVLSFMVYWLAKKLLVTRHKKERLEEVKG